MYRVVCDETNNTPETIERNELRATIYIVPHRWHDDAAYLAWHDPELRASRRWVLNSFGAVELNKGATLSLDWKQRKYEAGSEVLVTDIHGNDLGKGVLLFDYDADSDDNAMPEIRLADGKIILGCECWWIPAGEVRGAVREQGSPEVR